MALLSRKKPAPEPEPAVVLTKGPGGKGRATPKRSAAIKARPVTPYMQPVVTGGTRKERSAALKQARRGAAGTQRAALKGQADASQLPARDRSPERGIARQVVDGRRNLTTFVFAVYVLFFLTGIARGALKQAIFSLMLVALLIVVGDGFLLRREVRRRVRAAHPDSTQKVGFYSFQRSLLPRRFRLPKPGVGVPSGKLPAGRR